MTTTDMSVSDTIARAIRTWVAYRGLRMADLEVTLHITRTSVHHRLSGAQAWKPEELDKVAELLNCRVADLLTDPLAGRDLPKRKSRWTTCRSPTQPTAA